jgi:YesN/AraC family two-component response regulator
MINVVLIDDNESTIDLITSFIPKENYSVFSTLSAKTGFEYIKNNQVHILITDIIMPEVSGLEIISEMIKIKPNLKIIAISGGGAINTKQFLSLADGLGAHKVLPKPFVADDLLSALKELFPE